MVLTAGILGYGERGKTLARIVRDFVPELKLIAIADPVLERRKEISGDGFDGMTVYQSAKDLFDDAHPQVVIIASDPPRHCEHVLMAADRGCHIFCEKPLALSPEESDQMVTAVRKAGVVCTVDFETIFSDSFPILQKEIVKDSFGKLIRFDATDKGRPPAYDIETCMPHFLHLMMKLAGSRPVEVFSRILVDGRKANLGDVAPVSELYPVGRTHDIGLRADSIEVSYLFENGVTARYFLAALDENYVVEAGKSANKPGSEFMHFVCYGTRGQVKWHQTQTGFVYRKDVPADTLKLMDWELVYAPTNPDAKWIVPTTRLM